MNDELIHIIRCWLVKRSLSLRAQRGPAEEGIASRQSTLYPLQSRLLRRPPEGDLTRNDEVGLDFILHHSIFVIYHSVFSFFLDSPL
jgi:hypothetical protein